MKLFTLQKFSFLAVLIFTIACTKEKTEIMSPSNQVSDEQLVKQVTWFMDAAKEVKEGKKLKSGETMYLADALNCIESSMNYKYGYTYEKFKDYSISEVNLTIPYLSAENKTYVVDALDAFNLTLQKFRTIYQQLNLENKKFYMCSISNGGTTNDGDSVIINAKVYFGYGRRIINASTNEVGYYWFKDGGDCDQMGQYGAPNYLRDNYMPAIYLPCPNPRVWFDQTGDFKFNQDISNYPNPNGGPIDNYCDYQLYYATSIVSAITPDVKCVGSINGAIPEIEYYQEQLQDLFDTKLSSLNKQYMDVLFDTPIVVTGNTTILRHIPQLFYGKIHFDCSAISAEAMPLMD